MPKKNPNKVAPKWNYSVTFESKTDAPKATRGSVYGTSFATAAARAIKEARKSLPRLRASGVVVVVEKNDGANDFKV